jgi:hypothetical protein
VVFEKECIIDAHLLNELQEMDDVIVVSVGKLRKLWDSLSELRSSVCEGRLERTVLRPALLSVTTIFLFFFFLFCFCSVPEAVAPGCAAAM